MTVLPEHTAEFLLSAEKSNTEEIDRALSELVGSRSDRRQSVARYSRCEVGGFSETMTNSAEVIGKRCKIYIPDQAGGSSAFWATDTTDKRSQSIIYRLSYTARSGWRFVVSCTQKNFRLTIRSHGRDPRLSLGWTRLEFIKSSLFAMQPKTTTRYGQVTFIGELRWLCVGCLHTGNRGCAGKRKTARGLIKVGLRCRLPVNGVE